MALAACRPDPFERESLITEERILAVRGDPPESKPGQLVTYDLLVASPAGPVAAPAAEWAFCAAAKPLADNNSVSRDCLEAAVRPLGGPSQAITAPTPEDACSFSRPRRPPRRRIPPRDADITGGYYQPVRARTPGLTAFGMERLTCNLADAPVGAVQDYLARYTPNSNPRITAVTASLSGTPSPPAKSRPPPSSHSPSPGPPKPPRPTPSSTASSRSSSIAASPSASPGSRPPANSPPTAPAAPKTTPPPPPKTTGHPPKPPAPSTSGPSSATAAAASLSPPSPLRSCGDGAAFTCVRDRAPVRAPLVSKSTTSCCRWAVAAGRIGM